jgi:hypothetical protein
MVVKAASTGAWFSDTAAAMLSELGCQVGCGIIEGGNHRTAS